MPRNSSGVYTQPAGTTPVAGATIDPTAWESVIQDLGNEITSSVPRNGSAGMTAELPLSGNPLLPLGAVPKQYADALRTNTTTVALTSSNVTLTDAQCLAGRLLLTGTLTASVLVNLPITSVGQWVVDNQTSGAFSVTIASVGAGASLVAAQGARTPIWHDGANIRSGADGVSGTLAANSITPAKLALGAWTDVASAATVDLGALATRNVRLNGTTPVLSFGATPTPDNVPFQVRFTGILTLTRSASLETPTGASITTTAGDAAVIVQETTGNWRVVSYVRASGIALSVGTGSGQLVARDANGLVGGLVSSATLATTSGTAVTQTGIPATATRITIAFGGVSLSGAAHLLVQIGVGSVQSTGYDSTSASVTNAGHGTVSAATGFVVHTALASRAAKGVMTLVKISSTQWAESHAVQSESGTISTGGGLVTISGSIDRVIITSTNGTDALDAGAAVVTWE